MLSGRELSVTVDNNYGNNKDDDSDDDDNDKEHSTDATERAI